MNPNNYIKQSERGLKRKLELISYKGCKCEKCGYDKNISALEFHHLDPEKKEFQLDMRHLSNTHIDRLKNEVDKCILVCANCHRELHHPELEMNNIESLLDSYKTKSVKVFDKKKKMSICPNCGKEFTPAKGKIYCCPDCEYENKHYPSKDEVLKKYNELHSWENVANYFGLTRKIIQGIRKR